MEYLAEIEGGQGGSLKIEADSFASAKAQAEAWARRGDYDGWLADEDGLVGVDLSLAWREGDAERYEGWLLWLDPVGREEVTP